MQEGTLTMSAKERERLVVIRRVEDRKLLQREAAERLGISVRQVKRLVRRRRVQGDAGLVSRQRKKASNNRLAQEKLARLEALLREKYPDFGATLAAEKLEELDGLNVSRETVRRVQIALGLHKPKARRVKRVFQSRERRPRFGELVQIDGSPHDWFEGRGPRCTLIVFIDDATSKLTSLLFAPSETTRAYLQALRAHVLEHGAPLAFYSDRHGIFRVNAKESVSGDGLTEFGRVLKRLTVESICAHTPQAKGRVERANQTLQDRLVKELRLRNISNLEEANAFLPAFIKSWNEGAWIKPAREAQDAHRPWTRGPDALDEALAKIEERRLSKNLMFQHRGTLYSVKTTRPGTALRGATVTLVQRLRKRALSVAWRVRSTQGNIGFSVQKDLLGSVLAWLPSDIKIMLAADRFYGTAQLIDWCQKAGWSYRIRLKGNLTLAHEGAEITTGDVVTLIPKGVRDAELYGSGVKTNIGVLHEKGHKEPWIIAMDANPSTYTTLDYGMRWGIENMFSDFKSRGFGLMQSQIQKPDRMERLILIMSMALYWATSCGMFSENQAVSDGLKRGL